MKLRRLSNFTPILLFAAVALGASGCASLGTSSKGAPGQAAALDTNGQASTRGSEAFASGREAAARGDSLRAEQYLKLALEQGYDFRAATKLLVAVSLKGSRLRAALDYAEGYLRAEPDNFPLRYLVAVIHVGLGQDNEAEFKLEELLHEAPTYADAHYLLGVIRREFDVDSARAHFLTYLSLAPRGDNAADAQRNLAQLEVRANVREQQRARRMLTPPGFGAESQYAEPQRAEPQRAELQYAQPQYAQPQYAQPQRAELQYAQPQYAQPLGSKSLSPQPPAPLARREFASPIQVSEARRPSPAPSTRATELGANGGHNDHP